MRDVVNHGVAGSCGPILSSWVEVVESLKLPPANCVIN